MSSTWNRSYIEAIGLPVWVSRQVLVSGMESEQVDIQGKQETTNAESNSVSGFISVSGSQQAQAYILIGADQDLKQAHTNFLALAQAWKRWQDTEFPLTLAQLIENVDSSDNSQPLDLLSDKLLLLTSTVISNRSLAKYSTQQIPRIDWQTGCDKKAWWQLLQKLA